MKQIITALLLSAIIHIIFLMDFNLIENEKKIKPQEKKQKQKQKTDIKYVKLVKPKQDEKLKKQIKKEIEKDEKIEQKKEIKPKEKIKQKEKIESKVEEKPKRKIKKENIKKAKEFQKKAIKEQIVKEKNSIQENTLENFLSQEEPVNKKMLSDIEKLYGQEFNEFTKVQKAFIKKHLNTFKAITQRTLNKMGYPKLAQKLQLSGRNSISFTFHPNGDISDLKLTSSSGYEVFDEYTIELIKIAYKDYPRPKTATKLRFNVIYTLY
ncbi:MAG: energy transducer TonB [Campylobacterota bacterium]